ncbi:hypothetical protein CBR65_08370 [Cellvibrio sp. PSBB006]|nr:hypothetical protein CBR65_08370 [Cellvibrio sp. PSBB006]
MNIVTLCDSDKLKKGFYKIRQQSELSLLREPQLKILLMAGLACMKVSSCIFLPPPYSVRIPQKNLAIYH